MYVSGRRMAEVVDVRTGLQTGDNEQFLRLWTEVSAATIRRTASGQGRWVPYVKSRIPRRWYSDNDFVVDWQDNGTRIRRHTSAVLRNEAYYGRQGISFNGLSKKLAARFVDKGAIFDQKNSMVFAPSDIDDYVFLAMLNSSAAEELINAISPSGFGVGAMQKMPLPDVDDSVRQDILSDAKLLVEMVQESSAEEETSLRFESLPLATQQSNMSLREAAGALFLGTANAKKKIVETEVRLDKRFSEIFGISAFADEPLGREEMAEEASQAIRALVSYSVGCMFGRYSLDTPGLVLADQGDTLAEYLAKVPSPSFVPDEDNVLPVLSDAWFEDDIVERFREFLKVSFGVEHFEGNLRFVEESLGKDIRRYFVQDFYKDHVQRYKKRPIYWMFSSPKGSFNALIYMHRYRPDTASVVLNDYLREFQAKLRARRVHLDQVSASTVSSVKEQTKARKESELVGRTLLELEEWEQSVLYPLATEQIEIDLDDGVKTNYPKFGAALNNKYTGF